MSISHGVLKQTRFKRQTALGTLADGSSGGQILRRTSSVFELKKATYDTAAEITSTQQLKSVRHGTHDVSGALDGILSPGTYSDFLSALVRKDFAAVSDITAASITVAGTGPYTITRAAGSFLTDGIHVGMVVSLTAGGFNAGNLNNNILVTGVVATVLTGVTLNGSTLVAEGPIAAATVHVPGKVSYAASTAQTAIYYTVEEWHPGVPSSERNKDVVIGDAAIALPGSGNATVKFMAAGLDQTQSTTAYFVSPTAETSSDSLVAASGVLLVNGTAMATVTDLQIKINGNLKPADGVVGSNLRPDIFVGKVMATGQFTAYFDGTTVPNLFINETVTTILSALTTGTANNADFMAFALTKLKLTSSTPDDNETGLKRTYQYIAELDSAGGAGLATQLTTIQIQDSLAP